MSWKRSLVITINDSDDDESNNASFVISQAVIAEDPTRHPLINPNSSNNNSSIQKPEGMDEESWKVMQQLLKPVETDPNKERVMGISETIKTGKETCFGENRLAFYLHQRNIHGNIPPADDFQQHIDEAIAQQMAREEQQMVSCRNLLSREQVLASLLHFQWRAVQYVTSKAQAMHYTSLPQLAHRVTTLGFTTGELQKCLEYIRDDAPIVIHLTEATFGMLVHDKYYRNLFETNCSGGSMNKTARDQWERNMFGNCYNVSDCRPCDRPKYGCLNIAGDIEGVKPARHYGTFYLILHSHLRHRATFFNKDSNNFVPTHSLATNQYYAHILNNYNDADLITALHTCKSARIGGTRSNCATYKEVQIHGPVCLATDIQALSVPGQPFTVSSSLTSHIRAFQRQTGCNILWQGELLQG